MADERAGFRDNRSNLLIGLVSHATPSELDSFSLRLLRDVYVYPLVESDAMLEIEFLMILTKSVDCEGECCSVDYENDLCYEIVC